MTARAPRWTRAQAREVIEQFEASGQTMARYGREHGLNPERIRKWRAKFRREAAKPEPRLVELIAKRSARSTVIRVHCPSGHWVEAGDVELLDGLRAALKAVSEVTEC